MRWFALIAGAALVLLGAASGPAHAQRGKPAPAASNDKESAEYRQLVQQALDEFQRGNWDEAAGLFAQAHKLSPSARTLRGMGLAAFEGRRYVDALRDLRAALESTVNPLTAEQRAEVTDTVSRAEHYVAQLELTVEPAEAQVQVNGNVIPEQDGVRRVVVDPGVLEVRTSAPGYDIDLRQVRMVSGARQQLAIRLNPVSSGQPGGGTITGGGAVPAERARSGPPYQTLAWLSVGLAAAGGVAAVVAWQVREGAADEYNDAKCRKEDANPEQICSDSLARVDSAETGIIVSSIAGGAFLAAGVVFFVLDGNQGSGEHASTTACGAGPGELGVSCRLRF